jgi:hypothetical protein
VVGQGGTLRDDARPSAPREAPPRLQPSQAARGEELALWGPGLGHSMGWFRRYLLRAVQARQEMGRFTLFSSVEKWETAAGHFKSAGNFYKGCMRCS